MNGLDSFLLSFIFITFPLLLYLFYVAHSKNIEKKENDLFLGLALFSSIYLLIKLGFNYIGEKNILLINIPIIIAYIKNRKIEAILLSMIAIFYYIDSTSQLWILLIVEYIIYWTIYLLKEKNIIKINDYVFGSIVLSLKLIMCLISNSSVNVVNNFIISYIIMCFVIMFLKKGDDILKYHMTFKELENEKQIRLSLFKITHEIKNPLAVCKGYLDMLNTSNKEQCIRYIPIIKEEIDRTLLLLKDFLSVSKIKLDIDILDVTLLLEESLESLKTLLKEKGIALEFNFEDEIYINGDYNRLSQVIINIIKNSIEAIGDKKEGKITIKIETDNKYVAILFIDNGMGISKENLKRIKEPFFTTKPQGTGLGVSLSYEIIEAHHGTINYETEYGEGTKVTIKIPLMD
ncbi:MAG: HAMP domain-containing histidine kinase [Firmicutes bacterium]|nr:HAMP domain-containing histidine kinase [Bacillota bacterium]